MTKLFSVKIGLENKEINGKIQSDGNIYDISGFNFRLNKEKGLYSLSLFSKRNDKIKWIALKIPNPRGLFGPNLYFYDDSFGTNAQTQIRPFMDNNCFSSGQVVVYKNLDNNITFGVGYVEANRFFQTIMQKKSQVELIIDIESKALNDKEVYQFERFILSQPNEDTLHFLDRYAKTIKKVNHIQINDQIPSGFCSWSRYYSDIDEKKINGQIEYTYKYLKDKSPNVIQLDDGWQKHSSFPGIYEVDLEKFPNGLEPLIKKTNQKHMNFGLWFAPTLIKTSAPRFDEIKDLVCFDNKIDCLGSDIYAFDFDNPKFYEFLKKQFSYYAKVLGVKYFKVDFLEHPFSHGYNYQTDYKMALFRKALMAIREACGSDVSLVGCTGFVLPFANIFKVNRITCDVIWNNSSSIEASYQLIRRVSKTISYRYFYNNNLQINDPDGIVVRNYDVGDHYSASFGEAKIVTSMICSSGGSILHNEELNNLEEERLNLLKPLDLIRPLSFVHTTIK